MSKFQIILLSTFGFFIILAVVVFAFYRGGSSSLEATVAIWGDIHAEDFNVFLNNTIQSREENLTIKYRELSSESIDREFTEALARGEGPDLLLTTQDKLWKEKSKLLPIPYESISERDFKQTFVEEGELFLGKDGIYGLPLSIDPMVLYYNRDLLTTAGLAQPIGYWDEIYSTIYKLTRRDGAGNLVESAIALGEARNIPHAKDILSLLLLQAGTPITSFTAPPDGGELRSYLSANFNLTVSPGESALDFYTQFSNPSKPYYSWNRTLPPAQARFVSGDSAYYLGFASELKTLRNKNPNLNFSVTTVPQSRVQGRTLTFGRLRALSISRGTRSPAAALNAALSLVAKDEASVLSQVLNLPPARRNLLSQEPAGAEMPVFYEAALQSKGWLDPDDERTRAIFGEMIEQVTSGRARTLEALNQADRALEDAIKQ
ncbi:MAG: extracellular solute-binding protein [Patescibacteria group bacterium]